MKYIPAFFICLLLPLPALASTLNYNESSYAGGDFPSTGYPSLGYLDVGTNTVSGGLYMSNGSLDEDTFSVEALAGTEIVSEQIDFTYLGTSGTSITEPIHGTTDINSLVNETLTPMSPITGVIDVSLQGLPIEHCSGFDNTPPCNLSGSDYTITYTVDEIPAQAPEPSSLGLSASGLALCGLVCLWKRRAGARTLFEAA